MVEIPTKGQQFPIEGISEYAGINFSDVVSENRPPTPKLSRGCNCDYVGLEITGADEIGLHIWIRSVAV